MAIANVNLYIPDDLYQDVLSGSLQIAGLVKDNKNIIRKHLPAVGKKAKDGAVNAAQAIKNNRGLGIAGLIIGGLAVIGGVFAFFFNKSKKKAQKSFGKTLQTYIDAAKKGTLTTEIIDDLIKDLKAMGSKDIPLNLSAKQLSILITSIYDYTKELASENNLKYKNLKSPKHSGKNIVIDLQNYLQIQKDIINKVA